MELFIYLGIFDQCRMGSDQNPVTQVTQEMPFNNQLYLVATALDPQFALRFVDMDVYAVDDTHTSQQIQDEVKDRIKGKFPFLFLQQSTSESNKC